MTKCYMCDSDADGLEHVPPRCLFPKAKDLPCGVDLRRNLMTVPSCSVHNSEKSRDDVYFQNILTSCEEINEVGRQHYRKQMRRQHKHSRSMLARLRDHSTEVGDKLAIRVEIERLDNFAEHLALALYFAHFGRRWEGQLGWVPEFLPRVLSDEPQAELKRQEVIESNNREFVDVPRLGENPEVFSYQVIEGKDWCRMRLAFYEGCKIFLLYTS